MVVYIDEMFVIKKERKSICLFLPKYIGQNFKHEIEFTLKYKEFNMNLNEISQLLSKFKYGNNIHEHGKQ